MAVSDAQYVALLSRLTALENSMNDVLVASNRFVTVNQVHQLLTLVQTTLDSLVQDVDALQTRVANIEDDPVG